VALYRWFICTIILYGNRKVIEMCFRWVMQRKAFGKPLIELAVVREKLAKMIARNEAAYAWLENITYQMTQMDHEEQNLRLAGPISLLKWLVADVTYYINDEACQLFGGRAITKSGMGQYIERFQSAIKFGSCLGGASEVMADLGVKMAMRFFPQTNSKL
jgi:alkylation response protein AidB-like acyl-CoA dehydrogenase